MHIQVSTKYRKPQIENEQLDAGRKILICFDDFPNETSIDRVFPATFDHYKSPLVYPMIFPFHHDCHWNPKDPMEITWEISWFTSFLQRWNRKSPVFSNGFSREKKTPVDPTVWRQGLVFGADGNVSQERSASLAVPRWFLVIEKNGAFHRQDMEIM